MGSLAGLRQLVGYASLERGPADDPDFRLTSRLWLCINWLACGAGNPITGSDLKSYAGSAGRNGLDQLAGKDRRRVWDAVRRTTGLLDRHRVGRGVDGVGIVGRQHGTRGEVAAADHAERARPLQLVRDQPEFKTLVGLGRGVDLA